MAIRARQGSNILYHILLRYLTKDFQISSSEVGELFEAVLARGKSVYLDGIVTVSPREQALAVISQLREVKERLTHQEEELARQATAERGQ